MGPKICFRHEFADSTVTVVSIDKNPLREGPLIGLKDFVEDYYWLVVISIKDCHQFLNPFRHMYQLVVKKDNWQTESRALCGRNIQFVSGDEIFLDVNRLHCFDHHGGWDTYTLMLRGLDSRLVYELPLVLNHEKVT